MRLRVILEDSRGRTVTERIVEQFEESWCELGNGHGFMNRKVRREFPGLD